MKETLACNIEYLFYAKDHSSKTMEERHSLLICLIEKELIETYNHGLKQGLNKSIEAIKEIINNKNK